MSHDAASVLLLVKILHEFFLVFFYVYFNIFLNKGAWKIYFSSVLTSKFVVLSHDDARIKKVVFAQLNCLQNNVGKHVWNVICYGERIKIRHTSLLFFLYI